MAAVEACGGSCVGGAAAVRRQIALVAYGARLDEGVLEGRSGSSGEEGEGLPGLVAMPEGNGEGLERSWVFEVSECGESGSPGGHQCTEILVSDNASKPN